VVLVSGSAVWADNKLEEERSWIWRPLSENLEAGENNVSCQLLVLTAAQWTAFVSGSPRWKTKSWKGSESGSSRTGIAAAVIGLARQYDSVFWYSMSRPQHSRLQPLIICWYCKLPKKHSSTHFLARSYPYHTTTCSSTLAQFSDASSEMVNSHPDFLVSVLLVRACSVICRAQRR
jgi:hypothetical protein